MSENKKMKIHEIKEIELDILEKEKNAFIVMLDGWRKRVYFDKNYVHKTGNKVKIKYTGDIKDVHSVRFLDLK